MLPGVREKTILCPIPLVGAEPAVPGFYKKRGLTGEIALVRDAFVAR